MPKRQQQKVKGCKKAGRTKRKGLSTPHLSAYVKNYISAQEYFKLTNQHLKQG